MKRPETDAWQIRLPGAGPARPHTPILWKSKLASVMRQAHRAGEPNVGLQYRYDADVYRCLERDGMLRELHIGNVTERDRDRGKELRETASHVRGCALHVAGLLVAIPLLLDAEDDSAR